MEDKNIIAVYNQVKEWVNGHEVNAATIVLLVTQLIPIVQKTVNKHDGAYKKLVVMSVLEMVISDSSLDVENKIALNLIVQTTVPITIDTMVGIANGDIDLAKYHKTVKTCWLGCIRLDSHNEKEE